MSREPEENFFEASLGDHTGIRVSRLGLSATYRPGRKALDHALDQGLNFFFCYGFDTQMTKRLREIFPGNRAAWS